MLQFKRILKALLRYKTSSGLTLLSLVISFLGILILTLYVSYEKSFDGFHKNEKQVYRLTTKMRGASIPAVFSDVIQENIPEVESITPFCFWSGKISTTAKSGSTTNFPASMLYANNSFFDLFTFPLQLGNQTTALTEPNTVVISESFSKKLFSSGNPLGESLLINGESFKVSGVMTDFPKNSSFQADCVTSFATCLKDGRYGVKEWSEWSCNIFVKLRKGTNPEQVAAKMEQLSVLAAKIKDLKSLYPNQPFMELTPLEKIHFLPASNYQSTNPLILNVLILLIVILTLMGAVNFINFSTSQAPLRSKALVLRQVLGGKKRSSMGQIIAESVLLSIAALAIVLGIHQLSYPTIESLFGISGLSFGGRYLFFLWFFLFAVGFGILAGLYPAWYITSSPVSQSIKGNAHFLGKGKAFRSVLITIQFVFTISLIVSAFVIEKQLNYWRNFDIGLHKEQVVYLHTTPRLQSRYQAFADELTKNKSIVDFTYSESIPGGAINCWSREVDGQQIQVCSWPVDDHFLDFFGIKIAEGRKFAKGSKADINTFILNKKAVEKFGWENPLERKIDGVNFKGQVIGITENFNFSSLKEEISPMLFWLTEGRKYNLLLRIKPGNITETIDYIKSTALKFDGENPIEVQFLDDALNQLYEKEEHLGRFIEFVSVWCMLLAVTGLLGLIIFICRDRIKEIGIRKVNGATIAEVVLMLNTDIIKWVVVAFVIAVPIAWYAMNKWLENFAYKTELSWWIFALAGLLALGIALLTVSWQSWKAAMRNPVEALRNE
jgi:putative ABC transport system permease protein